MPVELSFLPKSEVPEGATCYKHDCDKPAAEVVFDHHDDGVDYFVYMCGDCYAELMRLIQRY